MTKLLLVRHLESEKNAALSLSSADDGERLTAAGAAAAPPLASALLGFAHAVQAWPRSIYCTRSARAEATAEAVAAAFGTPVRSFEALRSTRSGRMSGLRESEVRSRYPQFWEQLQLYRRGIFDAYRFGLPGEHEDKREFEKRVGGAIDEILAVNGESLKIVVAHRSSITATLIRFARRNGDYPADFYGYVPIGLGRCCQLESRRDLCRIVAVDVAPDQLVR